jgi:hypothetical protein
MSMQILGTRFQLALGDLRFTIGLSIDAQHAADVEGGAS